MESQENNLIMHKIKEMLSNDPVSVSLTDDIDVSYDDINNIWEYYKLTSKKYIKKHTTSQNQLTFMEFLNAKTIFEDNDVFEKMFDFYLDQESDYLLLFYKKGEEKFNCLFKTFNKIDEELLKKINRETENNFSLFWKIELKMSNLQTDFEELFTKLNLDNNAVLIVSFY